MLGKSDQYHPPLPDNLQPNTKQEKCSPRQDLIKRLPSLSDDLYDVQSSLFAPPCYLHVPGYFLLPSSLFLLSPMCLCPCLCPPRVQAPSPQLQAGLIFVGFASLVCLTAHHGNMGVLLFSHQLFLTYVLAISLHCTLKSPSTLP